jgi:hypothetical protein
MGARHIDYEIETLPGLGEVLPGVVNDVVGTDRSDHVHVPRAAHTGHARSKRFGDLHGERTHASRRANNQDPLPCLYPSSIAETLKGGECRDGYGCSLLKRDAGRFRQESVPSTTHEFGEGALAQAEYFITWLKLRDVPAGRLDMPRNIDSQDTGPGFEEAASHAQEIRQPSHVVPIEWIDGSGADSHQHVVGFDSRLVQLLEFQNVR